LANAFGVIQMLITDQVATAPCTVSKNDLGLLTQTLGVIKLNYYKELLQRIVLAQSSNVTFLQS
jgi:hypothetical protein